MLRARPVRSVLSLLGIYIGVLALIVILAIHEGTRQLLENLYSTQGARVVLVFPGFDRDTKSVGRIEPEDAKRLSSVPGIDSALLLLTQEGEIRSSAGALQAHYAGTDASFVPLYRIPIMRGREFLPSEVATRQPVCLLSDSAAQKLFPVTDPLNARVTLAATVFQVIGIFQWRGPVTQRTFAENLDALVPFPWVSPAAEMAAPALEVRVHSDIAPRAAVELVKHAMSHGDVGRAKLFTVLTLENYFRKRRESNDQALKSLLAIAAVSLFVGGIGIANVMLTSVTERTREVGLRKAVGARRRDILMQFLVESSVLSATGGLLAGLSGWIAVNVIPVLFEKSPNLVFPRWQVGACLVLTLVIGLVAGLYPASRAAALSPAEALRYE